MKSQMDPLDELALLAVVVMILALLALVISACIPSRTGPPVGHRREVCNEPDGGYYSGLLRAGDAIFLCPERQ